ncbi:heme exporter protein CcmB [Qipengyuania sp. JC766]|uniref:heme exporter protein CcmB n=1 Tax=Qipengyuania sp. JC766 TaxID=3232139 RepID=UPI0034593801
MGRMLYRDIRDLLRVGALLPTLFFLAVAMVFPFAVGPDPVVLARTGGGVIWVAALLASILPLDRLIRPDLEKGVFDQFALRGIAPETAVAVRLAAHWLTFAPFLIVASLPAAALLNLDGRSLAFVLLGLLAGTPGLAATGIMIAAVTSGIRGSPALGGLLLVPLALPVLIFGAGALARFDHAALAICGAISLALCCIAPFAGGAALRAARGS